MKKEKKKRNERIKKQERVKKGKHKLIHSDKQTHRQTDEQTDGQKSFTDMRYYTEQYSK